MGNSVLIIFSSVHLILCLDNEKLKVYCDRLGVFKFKNICLYCQNIELVPIFVIKVFIVLTLWPYNLRNFYATSDKSYIDFYSSLN